ncbi:hypothetical protein CLOM_g19366 [Closterium sp. NIES-68]|nr:hypothetical protein CLOM_g19366 [Closterium sp. NIES-68]GJP76864.1 hypothetical protein CLOP_g7314 [Closterium sp. NIES-67]
MEKRRLLLATLILCALASVASSKTLLMRATAILTGLNLAGGPNGGTLLGYGRATISVYTDGLLYEVRTFVSASNLYSNGNLPLYGVYIGSRFTAPDSADVRVPPFIMNWKNSTLSGPINRQVKLYSYHATRKVVYLTRFLYTFSPAYKLMNNPRGHFAVISYYGNKCALRGQFIKTYGWFN